MSDYRRTGGQPTASQLRWRSWRQAVIDPTLSGTQLCSVKIDATLKEAGFDKSLIMTGSRRLRAPL
jgi:hypothetical protein